MWMNIITSSILIHFSILSYLFYQYYLTLNIDDQEIFKLFILQNLKSFVAEVSDLSHINSYTLSNILSPFNDTYLLSFASYLLIPLVYIYFNKRTSSMFSKSHLRGSSLASEKDLLSLIRKTNEEVRVKISHVHSLPKSYEVRHGFICGTTGAGKTVLMSSIIRSLIEHNERAVIYDAKDGEFVAKYYNPEIDIIFNPFDDRSVSINVFDYIRNQSDFDKMAKAIVPEQIGSKDPIFQNNARDILAAILRVCYQTDQKTNEAVWNYLNYSIKDLRDTFRETGNERVAVSINNPSSGTSQSFMSTLMQYAKIFEFMETEDREVFSITEWLNNPNARFLFLPNNVMQKDSLSGIFSLFFNIICNEILSMRDDSAYRIFLLMDEFGTLKKMDSIKDLLTLGRSKGVSCWLGIQEKSQIDSVYGQDISKTLINQCNIKFVFRLNESDTMEYFSKNIGENETESMETSYSAGVEDNKDGENYRRVMKKERLVLPAELAQLPDLKYYLKLPNKPYCLTHISYQKDEDLQPSFVQNEFFSLDKLKTYKVNSEDDSTNPNESTPADQGGLEHSKTEASLADSKSVSTAKKSTNFFNDLTLEDDASSMDLDDL